MSQYDFFISYSSDDLVSARTIVERLNAEHGLRGWLDHQENRGGSAWMDSIERAIAEVPAVIVCLGRNPLAGWPKLEVQAALRRKIREPAFNLVPVLLQGVRPALIPSFLGSFTAIRLPNPFDRRQIAELAAALTSSTTQVGSLPLSNSLRAAAAMQVRLEIAALERKYVKTLYIDRPNVRLQLDAFLGSNAQVLLVLDEAGSGKTNFACHIALNPISSCPTFLFRAATLGAGAVSIERALSDAIESGTALRFDSTLFEILKEKSHGLFGLGSPRRDQ